MNLEHHRKQAKRLLRAVRAGAADERSRVAATLGDQPPQRFQLSDALHVIARELGFRSWPELKAASNQPQGSSEPERIETTIDTGLEYRPGDPVRVRVVRRGTRTWVSDDGGAFERARRPTPWHDAAQRVEREFVVNFSRGGVIALPVVPAGPSEERVVRRIGEASRAFFQELLELS